MLDATKVKESLTQDDIIRLCCHLQEDDNYLLDAQGRPLFLTSLDHDGGDSYKLCYFDDSKLFYVYTRGLSYDVFELVRRAMGYEEFSEAFRYVCDFFGLRDIGFEEEKPELIDDWDIFQRIDDYSKPDKEEKEGNQPIQENILEYWYPLAAPTEWYADHITPKAMFRFGIRVDSALSKIIIPHRDAEGRLIGVRGRSYDPIDLANGMKYAPVQVEGRWLNHKLGLNLYGLYENGENIRRLKKVAIFEAEKSVLQCESYYGSNNNFALATCGSNLSQEQMDLILGLGVEEVVLCYDKEWTDGLGQPEYMAYREKLRQHVQYLSQYCSTYIVMDKNGLLSYKESPSDEGREVLESLMEDKEYVPCISNNDIKRRRKK